MAEEGTARLQGRTALVTGGGRGIGRAVALALAREGAAVVVSARHRDELDGVVAEIGAAGGRAFAVPADVTSDDDVEALAVAARDVVGSVGILVNSAGIIRPGRFLDYSLDDWKDVFDVNVHGTVRATRALLGDMVDRGWGRVINIASTAGKYASPNQSVYNASKHAVVGLTRCLALETAAQGITVNAICPGFVATGMVDHMRARHSEILGVPEPEVERVFLSRVPLGRFLAPEEVAGLAVYLASDDAAGMTGAALTLAGGLIFV